MAMDAGRSKGTDQHLVRNFLLTKIPDIIQITTCQGLRRGNHIDFNNRISFVLTNSLPQCAG